MEAKNETLELTQRLNILNAMMEESSISEEDLRKQIEDF
jgi:hypothetical protein